MHTRDVDTLDATDLSDAALAEPAGGWSAELLARYATSCTDTIPYLTQIFQPNNQILMKLPIHLQPMFQHRFLVLHLLKEVI